MNGLCIDNQVKKHKILMPESLRIWLIDDFDFIIQQNKIFRLPSKKSITHILNDYMDFKIKKKYMDEWDSFDDSKESENEKYVNSMSENVNGLIKYFNSMLGSQLLYKFERLQYAEVIFF